MDKITATRRGLLLAILLLGGLVLFLQTHREPNVGVELAGVKFTVPRFVLTDQKNEPFGSRELDGNVWVANFIFTRCALTCPAQTAKMVRLQTDLAQNPAWDSVRLISITVDPEHDTPEVLNEFTRRYGVDDERWKFLTGPHDRIYELSQSGFRLSAGRDTSRPEGSVIHSSKFVLVDDHHRVHGYYEGTSDEELDKLRRDLALLVEAKTPAPISTVPRK